MRGMDLELVDVSIRFGDFTAVRSVDLKVEAGEFFSILGPSGCGKTTILRMISGFLNPTSGDIRIGGQSMIGIDPRERPTALIFQNLALFPMMTVWENVAFGLEMRGWRKNKRRQKARELLDLVALGDQEDKMPNELSGGQRQRVAVARALAVEPAVLLLDEPLSALDLKLRQHVRSELREIQRQTGVTFIYITHDQGEALTMSDRIAVMRAGHIEQVGTTDSVYNAPATAFTATFVGENNVFSGKIIRVAAGSAVIETGYGALRGTNPQQLAVGSEAILFVRPEKMQILSGDLIGGIGGIDTGGEGAENEGSDNRIDVKFLRRDLEGPFVNLFFERGEQLFSVHLTNVDAPTRNPGERCAIGFDAHDGVILPHGDMTDE